MHNTSRDEAYLPLYPFEAVPHNQWNLSRQPHHVVIACLSSSPASDATLKTLSRTGLFKI